MRYKIERAVSGGWTEWIRPTPPRYYCRCCDCGLVHAVEFRVVGGVPEFRARRVKKRARAQESEG